MRTGRLTRTVKWRRRAVLNAVDRARREAWTQIR